MPNSLPNPLAVNPLQKQRGRGPGRPFPKGVSGDPAWRPLGARNAATQFAEALLDGEAEDAKGEAARGV